MVHGTTESGKSHASTDIIQRAAKAAKIARLIHLERQAPDARRVLEIGTGSGVMAKWFADHGCDVTSVDVVDERVVKEGFLFVNVAGVLLPFPDGNFDIVISNHAIEHVGDAEAQQHHLNEMRRICRRDGVAYLAVPNRWMLIEPHYHLPLLSWLPRRLADFYVRSAGKGTAYDCRPLTRSRLSSMLANAGWRYEQQVKTAVESLIETEGGSTAGVRLIARGLPVFCYALLAPIFPTLIYVLRKQ